MNTRAVMLADKYEQSSGRVYLNGLQALVRALINQRTRDERAGLNTAGFVSGYRGSPVGTLDKELWRAAAQLTRARTKFVPGVNEELAANAVGGTQQIGLFPGARHDGVFAMWYGKGPGVDRCGDVLRHANLAGTTSHGGVLLVCGDDHGGVSTTTNHQSDPLLRALGIPILLPANVQDLLDLCAHGWAISRFTGLYVGLKALADTVEGSASVEADPFRVEIALPADAPLPTGGLGIRWPDDRWSQEQRLLDWKLPALQAYVRANRLNPITFAHPSPRLGIIASGKAYLDLMQAFTDFALGERELLQLGIRVCKVTVPWPLDRQSMGEFAAGLEEIAVVEEKAPLIEPQLRDLLYALPARSRPRIFGKTNDHAEPEAMPRADMLSAARDLNAARVERTIGAWLLRHEDLPTVRTRLNELRRKESQVRQFAAPIARAPYYCSGCPHSTSTKVPDGSFALAGVGCHYLALFIYPEQTRTFTVMGAEGSNWIGIAPFSDTRHAFVNLGEGSYFHSSLLAIRAAVAAGINITYRILYNDAVAMTGGQPMDGPLTVSMLVAQLKAEGVLKICVVAEELEVSREDLALPAHMTIHPRARLDAVQRELRDTPGCTALVYVQTCAAEKRRRRKRGEFADPARRIFINPEVCEGCGDCGKQSNCVSVVPLATALGVKRAIDQSNCNKDFSCTDGFCPSFVTVKGGKLRTARVAQDASTLSPLPDPKQTVVLNCPYNILITGIGGTGVITVGALLGMAAHLEGKVVSVLDMTGMAQKNGGVQSHIRITAPGQALACTRIPATGAHLFLACDLLEATSADALEKTGEERTRVVANSHVVMPGGFTQRPDELTVSHESLRETLLAHVRPESVTSLDATALATALTGSPLAANLLLLGFACQAGYLPVTAAAIEHAIELNGVSVTTNKQAFEWGRRAQHDPHSVERIVMPHRQGTGTPSSGHEDVQRLIEDRRRRLISYHSERYAQRYQHLIDRARSAEAAVCADALPFTAAVARYFFKLLAIKDEYEVARLHSDHAFRQQLAATFEGPYTLSFHLAPPLWAKADPHTGRPGKRAYGAWMMFVFSILARVRRLRGTFLDPFRFNHERQIERRLASDYEHLIESLCTDLSQQTLRIATQLASLPEQIRGFGPVKQASIAKVEVERTLMLQRLAAVRTAARQVASVTPPARS